MASAYKQKGDLHNARTYFQKSLTEHRIPDTLAKLSEVEKLIKEEERKAYINPELSLEAKNMGNDCFQKGARDSERLASALLIVLSLTGQYPEAIQHYNEAIKRNPDDAKIYSNRAGCYQKLAEFALALKDSEECIRLDPNFGTCNSLFARVLRLLVLAVKGHLRKGMALLAMKEYNKASSAFQKALEIDPNNQEALDGYRKCTMAQYSNPEEVRKRAMADPEVQQILGDPAMRLILEQMQSGTSNQRVL